MANVVTSWLSTRSRSDLEHDANVPSVSCINALRVLHPNARQRSTGPLVQQSLSGDHRRAKQQFAVRHESTFPMGALYSIGDRSTDVPNLQMLFHHEHSDML